MFIGGVLLLFFWLVIPLLVAIGNGVALGRAVALGQEEVPRFRLDQAVDGLKGARRGAALLAPTFILYALLFIPVFLASLEVRHAHGHDPVLRRVLDRDDLWPCYGIRAAAIFAAYISRGTIDSCLSFRQLWTFIRYWRGSYVAAAVIVFAISQLIGLGFILFVVGIGVHRLLLFGLHRPRLRPAARPLMTAEPPAGPFSV